MPLLPENNISASRVFRHVEAYTKGFEGNEQQCMFMNGMSVESFSADPIVIDTTIMYVKDKMIAPPDEVISYCFNRAGLELRQGDIKEKNWWNALRNLVEEKPRKYSTTSLHEEETIAAMRLISGVWVVNKDECLKNVQSLNKQCKTEWKNQYRLFL